VGLGACPSLQLIMAIPKSHESQFRQCAICPLTYLNTRATLFTVRTPTQLSQGGTKHPGKPPRPNQRTQRPSLSQRPCSRGPRHKRQSPSPHSIGSRAPSLTSIRRWKVHLLYAACPHQGPLPNRCPLSGERLSHWH